MKQLKATTNKKYTDSKYSFFTDTIYMPDDANTDEYFEVDASEADKIKNAKNSISINSKDDLDKAISNINIDLKTSIKYSITGLNLTDKEALLYTKYYPDWNDYINKSLLANFKIQYNNKLFKTRQPINVVLENQPPSIHTAALYEEINESDTGTLENPIPYSGNMELVKGKYYIQDNAVYLCTRSTGVPVQRNLKDLIGLYVTKVN